MVSVEEYVARFVDGDEKPTCEYEDGVLIPKALGTRQRSQVMANIVTSVRKEHSVSLNPLISLTTRHREGRFLVPDIAIEDLAKPISGLYPGKNEPLPLCIEIMSPPDRIGKLFGKCEEHHSWGVPYCWVIDPERKVAWEYFPEDLEPRKVVDKLTAGTIEISLGDVFRRV